MVWSTPTPQDSTHCTGRFEEMMGNSYYWTCHPVYDLATGAMIDYICEKIVTNNNSRCNGYSIRCIWGE